MSSRAGHLWRKGLLRGQATVRIRAYRRSDRAAVLALTHQSFERLSIDHALEQTCGLLRGRSWSWRKQRDVARELRQEPRSCWVAEILGRVVGYVTTACDPATGVGRILNVAVHSEYRGQGIGRQLLTAAIQGLTEAGMEAIRIETLEHNRIARRLYPRLGFREIARQIHYVLRVSPLAFSAPGKPKAPRSQPGGGTNPGTPARHPRT